MDLHVNDTLPPLDFLLDFSRTYRAAKEAAGSTPTASHLRRERKILRLQPPASMPFRRDYSWIRTRP